jgi:hypothetical protein
VVCDLQYGAVAVLCLGLSYLAVTHAQFLCLPTASAPATARCWVLDQVNSAIVARPYHFQ